MGFSKALVSALICLTLLLAGCSLSDGNGGGGNNDKGPVQAVFIGSSQLNDWTFSTSFPNNNYVKKAVLSDTSTEMLARFQADVVTPKPPRVVIWAGENDVDRGMALSTTQSNITQMHQMASAASIAVVLCTIPPKAGADAVQNPAIVTLNTWIKSYAADHNIAVADFYPVLVDANGDLKADYASGTEHLTAAAYQVITPIVQAAITAAK